DAYLDQAPDVRGVVHAAGVLQDGSLLQTDPAAFAAVAHPKAAGAWALDRLFADRSAPLDFFVSFSSAASLLGSPGQAAYAAANAVLDALAHDQRARGIRGLSINWGPWAEAGLAARADRGKRLSLRGVLDLAPDAAVAMMGPLLASSSSLGQVGVIAFDDGALRRSLEAYGDRPMFSLLGQPDGAAPAAGGRDALLALAAPDRRPAVEDLLRREAARVLGLGAAELPIDRSLQQLGFDSIMAIELRNRIRARTSVAVTLADLMRGPTLAQLADTVLPQLAGAAVPAPAPEPVPALDRAPSGDDCPLSFGQEGLWLAHQLDRTSAVYNVAIGVRFSRTLRRDALQRSFAELIRRHTPLRTTYANAHGQPRQVVGPVAVPAIEELDVRATPADQREAAALEHARALAHQPFDLGRGPVLRLALITLADADQVLVIVMHHITVDGWSLGVMSRELMELYEAFCDGRPSPLAEPPTGYLDYARWQRRTLGGEALAAQLDYWKHQLDGAPELLALPTDRPRPAVQTSAGARVAVHLPPAMVDALERLGRGEGATLFMTLLAGFHVLLRRYSGQRDICIGTSIAGRDRAEWEGLVGYFANNLVLRTRSAADPTFRELVAGVRDVALGAYSHEEVPFGRLVAELAPARSRSYAPLHQVMLVDRNAHGTAPTLAGAASTLVDIPMETAMFDLTLALMRSERGLEGWFEYNTDLFERATVARMAAHLEQILSSVLRDPAQAISQIEMLGDTERRRLVHDWNATAAELDPTSFAERVARIAAGSPAAIAASEYGAPGSAIGFGELDRRANQLAHHLRELGVGPDVVVGLCVGRSPALLVGLLGILKAGGAYLPLDPAYPSQRLAFMMRDAVLSVVVSELAIADELPVTNEHVICLDSDAALLARYPDTAPAVEVPADALAYVIYTSGSTGRPKGAMITHRGLANYLAWCIDAYRIEGGGGSLVHSSVAFDLTVTSLLAPLAAGRPVVLVPESLGAEGLGRALAEHRDLSLVKLTPSHLRLLELQLAPSEVTGCAGALIIGGEALPARALEFWQTHAPHTRLINEYGPTETVVGCCVHEVTAADVAAGVVPIGRPIANTELYVLDADLSPVPVGVTGELYIGGIQLGRGYLHRPDLTAERFVPSPFGPVPGARLYRTGDLARYRGDGCLEYLGRIDTQVKLRGFRIELGEIEVVLAQHPAVREAVAIVRTAPGATPGATGDDDRQLITYAVPAPGHALDGDAIAELRRALRTQLPEYMVPSAIVALDALPLTGNGKVDVAALPAPAPLVGAAGDGARAPRTEVEQIVAGIWSEVLGTPAPALDDDFFALGGHSLTATQVVARLRELFGIELGLAALFDAPTVARLAATVEAARRAVLGAPLPALRASARPARIPLSFAQQRLWFLDQMDPGSVAFTIPGVVRFTGALDAGALMRSFDELVARHEVLRTTFAAGEDGPYQVVAPPSPTEPRATRPLVAHADLSHLAGDAQEAALGELAAREAARPFDLARGPLLRATLVTLRPDAHALVIAMHHIVSDGWSMGILIRELAALYGALSRGELPALPALPLQYADYAVWQHRWLDDARRTEQTRYWTEQLAGAPATLMLPYDRPRPAVQSYRGAHGRYLIPAPLRDQLQAASVRLGVTPFMLVLAGFEVLLYRYSGQTDLVIGTDVANRSHADTEALLGFFVNQLVVRCDLSGDPSFAELVAQVRRTTLDAYAHGDVPFEEVVKAVNPARDLGHAPIFQIKLTQQPVAMTQLALPGLTLHGEPIDNGTSKLDLTVFIADTADGLELVSEYATDLFDASTVARLLGHLHNLLADAVARPAARISELAMLGHAERDQIVRGWNATAAAAHAVTCAHELFAAQAAQVPDAVAVICGDLQLTYRELDARANQLAHYLRQCGVRRDVPVGLCVERSVHLVVGLLGILKAGGAYVPLDPTYPTDRLAFMLRDAGIGLLLTEAKLVDDLPVTGALVVCLDEDRDALAAQPVTAPAALLHGDNLAYVIYTSGSTGQPKGAMVTHRGLVNYLTYCVQSYGVADGGGAPVHSSIAFDLTVTSLLSPLAAGRPVVLIPDEHAVDGLATSLRERAGFSLVKLTPSHLRLLELQLAPSEVTGCAGALIIGGEALPARALEFWQTHAPHTRL
ncbi:MAG TPA: amino acid adenylation domain-containing protein, partial [Kofleriaceae bacterium]|nr:amino acid adenylation domain-containing protein [Kofleriaceae bacterium]